MVARAGVLPNSNRLAYDRIHDFRRDLLRQIRIDENYICEFQTSSFDDGLHSIQCVFDFSFGSRRPSGHSGDEQAIFGENSR